MMSENDEARFWSKVDKTGCCWSWTAALRGDGYPTFWSNGRQVGAHRLSYEMEHGPIPSGMQIDHRCSNRACVNPDHLEPVTADENLRRRVLPTGSGTFQGGKTHCPQGHPYDEANTITRRYDGARVCRTCRREYRRSYRARMKVAA